VATGKKGPGRPTRKAVRQRDLGLAGARAIDKIETALAQARAEVKRVEDETDAEVRRVREEGERRKHLAKQRADLIAEQITAIVTALDGVPPEANGTTRRRKTTRRKRPSDPAKLAGKGNVEAVRTELRRRGRASQAEIARALDLNPGTASYAMRALADNGEAVKTDRLIGRSVEYAYVEATPETPSFGQRSFLARPGE
jgi:hypothetical protein